MTRLSRWSTKSDQFPWQSRQSLHRRVFVRISCSSSAAFSAFSKRSLSSPWMPMRSYARMNGVGPMDAGPQQAMLGLLGLSLSITEKFMFDRPKSSNLPTSHLSFPFRNGVTGPNGPIWLQPGGNPKSASRSLLMSARSPASQSGSVRLFSSAWWLPQRWVDRPISRWAKENDLDAMHMACMICIQASP